MIHRVKYWRCVKCGAEFVIRPLWNRCPKCKIGRVVDVRI